MPTGGPDEQLTSFDDLLERLRSQRLGLRLEGVTVNDLYQTAATLHAAALRSGGERRERLMRLAARAEREADRRLTPPIV